MRAPLTLLGRIRLAVAGLSLLIGSLGTLFGGLGYLVAWLSRRSDPHGAAMGSAASAPILGLGLILLLLAAIAWPRTRAEKGDGASAA